MNTAPNVTTADLQLLEAILGDTCGDWILAKAIAISWRWQEVYPPREGQSRDAWLAASERKIRAIASQSAGGIISFPGSKGYKLRVLASDEEIQTAIAKLKHQGAEMMARATAIATWSPTPVTAEQIQLV